MKFILRLKAWQLFILVVGLPLMIEIFNGKREKPEVIAPAIDSFFFLRLVVSILPLLYWWYTMGTSLHDKLPPEAKMPIGKFKFCLLFPLAYIFALTIISTRISIEEAETKMGSPFVVILIVIHLLAMLCLFYGIRFIAKALKTAEMQRPALFDEYLGDFFMLWFFPIGIWFIQPRINKIFEEQDWIDETVIP